MRLDETEMQTPTVVAGISHEIDRPIRHVCRFGQLIWNYCWKGGGTQ